MHPGVLSLVSVLATLTDGNKASLSQAPLLDDSRPALHEEGRVNFPGVIGPGATLGQEPDPLEQIAEASEIFWDSTVWPTLRPIPCHPLPQHPSSTDKGTWGLVHGR